MIIGWSLLIEERRSRPKPVKCGCTFVSTQQCREMVGKEICGCCIFIYLNLLFFSLFIYFIRIVISFLFFPCCSLFHVAQNSESSNRQFSKWVKCNFSGWFLFNVADLQNCSRSHSEREQDGRGSCSHREQDGTGFFFFFFFYYGLGLGGDRIFFCGSERRQKRKSTPVSPTNIQPHTLTWYSLLFFVETNWNPRESHLSGTWMS